jgi:hypothetical protein
LVSRSLNGFLVGAATAAYREERVAVFASEQQPIAAGDGRRRERGAYGLEVEQRRRRQRIDVVGVVELSNTSIVGSSSNRSARQVPQIAPFVA